TWAVNTRRAASAPEIHGDTHASLRCAALPRLRGASYSGSLSPLRLRCVRLSEPVDSFERAAASRARPRRAEAAAPAECPRAQSPSDHVRAALAGARSSGDAAAGE